MPKDDVRLIRLALEAKFFKEYDAIVLQKARASAHRKNGNAGPLLLTAMEENLFSEQSVSVLLFFEKKTDGGILHKLSKMREMDERAMPKVDRLSVKQAAILALGLVAAGIVAALLILRL